MNPKAKHADLTWFPTFLRVTLPIASDILLDLMILLHKGEESFFRVEAPHQKRIPIHIIILIHPQHASQGWLSLALQK
jgi:hypothetical protein